MTTISETTPPANPPQPPSNRDLRSAGVAMALSDVPINTAQSLLTALQWTRRENLIARLRMQLQLAREAEQRAANVLARATADHQTWAECLRRRGSLEAGIRDLAIAIRRKRHDAEARKIEAELERLDEERKETIKRLSNERRQAHQEAVQDWKDRAVERTAQANELKATRDTLVVEEKRLRDAAKDRMEPWMTRTASGFLIWAGYSVIGTTGIAVAMLLDDLSGRSLFIDIGTSAGRAIAEMSAYRLHPLIGSALGLLLFIASVIGLLVCIDLLMRWFDHKGWLKEQPTETSDPQPIVLRRAELGRSAFSKLLITVPFAYITGMAIAFIAYGGGTAKNVSMLGQATVVLNGLIGSALSLLSASMFILYFATILEPRTNANKSQHRWRRMWEVGVVPFVMVLAILVAAALGPRSRWSWAGLTAFMLLGTMALAYGLLYRGMFRDLEYATREIDDCDRRIAYLLRPPNEPRPSAIERRELDRTLSEYHQRRQRILDLDRERRIRRMLLVSDESDPTMVGAYQVASNWIWRVIVRRRDTGIQNDFYRTTDLEAAPVETAQRQDLEQQWQTNELELSILGAQVTRDKLNQCIHELDAARAERSRLEYEQPQLLAADQERQANETLDLEQSFAVAKRLKGAFDNLVEQREEMIYSGKRPTVNLPPSTSAEGDAA